MKSKEETRAKFRKIRESLSPSRRREARQNATDTLYEELSGKGLVLSFASKSEEIDLWLLNKRLADENRLALPRLTSDTEITPFIVDNVDELISHHKWNVLEPDPEFSKEALLANIECVLVPGIAFDSNHFRLGYGKGHYDRFLSNLSCPFWGIGFKEQKSKDLLETSEHDIPLKKLFLF